MTLSDAELDRYARHIVLREIGGGGQARLLASHVLLIGAGGIGSPAIQYLAAAGVGKITAIDDDEVALSNLQRQTLYGSGEVGAPKVAAAAKAVARLNPGVRFTGIRERIGAANADRLLGTARPDVILDGSDNFATRLAVADAAYRLRIPLVSAAVAEFEGQLGVFRGWEADKPCYRCFVGHDPERAEVSCAEQGVLGALTGVMGSLAALEAIRCCAPFGEDSAGKLLLVDALALRFRTLALPKDSGCTACS
ncbi:molybdopterin-synthase adenylyltransferase MoeB [Sphingomonas sp. JC676]|uniref:HesA/MoeB/ThiF family protein n=1 Tax=Sphingomonas sp. JC676 TaxID=2768065 RepID=UPI0016582FF1|nr:molybdopterin-synthase adenylyltransferase MoeB [Sphingomonas sp. JC676]MBC9030965.1 molybdopterin-synthase adenylyltransferase MoeB [Sphingomonas sp. JC676]